MAKRSLTDDELKDIRSTKNQDVFRRLIRNFPERPIIISEGDSWFAYPPKNLILGSHSNVIDHIQRKRKFNFLRLESNGDEVVSMISGQQGKRLAKLLKRYPVNIVLFSGGGNDIVGEYDMDLFLRCKIPDMDWESCIHKPRFFRKLIQIENAYRLLIDMRDEYSPDPKPVIITHTYDYPLPSFHGAEFLGGIIKTKSWMKPYMELKGITDPEDQKRIARYFLSEFAKVLKLVARDNPGKLIVVDTCNTLAPGEWLNEIHASEDGYKKIADKIYRVMEDTLRTNFPDIT